MFISIIYPEVQQRGKLLEMMDKEVSSHKSANARSEALNVTTRSKSYNCSDIDETMHAK